ncbi:MAG: hypothetical protein PVSMB10_17800 [Pseudarthrobacter sp.]
MSFLVVGSEFKIDAVRDGTHDKLTGFFGDHVFEAAVHDFGVAGLAEHAGEPLQFITERVYVIGVIKQFFVC